MSCTGDKQTNIDKAVEGIARAAERGGQVVCLQEVFKSISFQSEDYTRFDWAEEIPGPTSQRLSQAAAKHKVVVTCSLFERRTQGLYHNTAVTYDVDGSLAGMYRKMHIPDDPLYYEKFYFTPGDLGFTVAKTRYATLGVGVCWDQWYSEAARLFSLRGAEILLYPTAIGWHPAEKAEQAPLNMPPGKPRCGLMRSPMVCMLRNQCILWGWKADCSSGAVRYRSRSIW